MESNIDALNKLTRWQDVSFTQAQSITQSCMIQWCQLTVVPKCYGRLRKLLRITEILCYSKNCAPFVWYLLLKFNCKQIEVWHWRNHGRRDDNGELPKIFKKKVVRRDIIHFSIEMHIFHSVNVLPFFRVLPHIRVN